MAFTPPSSFPPRPRFNKSPVFERNPNRDEHRINERIRVPEVRLVDEKGNQLGVVRTDEALRLARERGLDLMEVSPNSRPPVCKICDYGKFKYEKKKKEHAAKKKQAVIKLKEIQLRPQTDEHDLDYKFKNARTFLEEGDKAKITMIFRGREVIHVEAGRKVMDRLVELTKDIAVVEAPAKLEGKKLIMILAPVSVAGKKPTAPTAAAKPVAPSSAAKSATADKK